MSDSKASNKRYYLYGTLLVLAGVAAGVQWLLTRETGVTWTEAPPETQGVWTTNNPRYAGRAIEVGPNSVTLRLGDAGAVPGRLVLAREVYDDDERILRLEYQTENGPDQLDMVVEANGSMYLHNQPEMHWTSDGSRVVAPVPIDIPVVVDSAPSPFGPAALGGVLLLLVASGAAVLWLFGRGGGGESVAAGPAPRIIRGVWTTPDPRFEGRSIRIAGGYGFAHFGPGDVRVGGNIENVEQWREDGERVVSLTYAPSDGAPQELDMVIDKSGHMRLRGGPKSIWVRRPD